VSASTTVRDTVTRTALLGVRFWDRATGRSVAEGLQLTDTASGTLARPSRSGVFVFHDLPGLRASAYGAGDGGFWASPPTLADLTFELVDPERRFMPFRFDATAPTRGVVMEACALAGSPPNGDIAGVPLFSTPSRPLPSGLAAVRAQLWDSAADEPAAWAVLEVSVGAAAAYQGIADAEGRVAVMLPYPEPPWHGSSPPPGSRSLSDQTWPVGIAVRYDGSAVPAVATDPPDLCAVLEQIPATPFHDLSPPVSLTEATLAFGRELVLRTAGHPVLVVSHN
jgi:hypothetical protein